MSHHFERYFVLKKNKIIHLIVKIIFIVKQKCLYEGLPFNAEGTCITS